MVVKIILSAVIVLVGILIYKKLKNPLLSIAFSLLVNITLISLCVNINFVTMPLPDKDVSEAFKVASSDVVSLKAWSYKYLDKYLVIVETNKEGKEMLERLQKKK